jgi:hypothetical protein
VADVGIQMVESLYQQLMVDDQWAIRRDRGFTWWAYRLAQHVEVGLPVRSGDLDVCIVRIWTEVAYDVDPAKNPAALVQIANIHQDMNALVWNSSDQTIAECCTAVVHEENIGWLGKVLAMAAVLQNTAAHTRAHAVADVCGGTPAASSHPINGERPEMDDILNIPEQLVMPAGTEPSRFTGPLSEGLGAFAASMGWFGSSDATGITCEVPFTGNRPLILQQKYGVPDIGLETALVRIFTDQPHPEEGNGALIVMQLPISPGADEAPVLANELNAVEAKGDLSAPLLGAWCPDVMSKDGNGLAFCCFLPNLIARPGLLENQIVYQAARAQFALRQLSER